MPIFSDSSVSDIRRAYSMSFELDVDRYGLDGPVEILAHASTVVEEARASTNSRSTPAWRR
jgi:hypothetical protein